MGLQQQWVCLSGTQVGYIRLPIMGFSWDLHGFAPTVGLSEWNPGGIYLDGLGRTYANPMDPV